MFFGRSGQWFGSNDHDGDKTSIFHDLDGSVTGYPDTFVGRADNYLLRHPGCLTVPRWNGVMCTGKFAQVTGGVAAGDIAGSVGWEPSETLPRGDGVEPTQHSVR